MRARIHHPIIAGVLVFWGAIGLSRPLAAAKVEGAGAVPPAASGIDQVVAKAAAAEGVAPGPLCDDSAFLRRLTIDLIGRIPTAAEYKDYMQSPPDQRRRLAIDRLLIHPELGTHWFVFFGDMFRVRYGSEGGSSLAAFLRKAVEANVPYDAMVRDMLTGTGTPQASPPVGFLTADDVDPFEMAGIVSQVLMGVRMKCAQCHDHPFDVWTQKDYYGLAAYFGKTVAVRREEPRLVRVVESAQSRVLWPPKPDEPSRRPIDPTWPFALAKDDDHIKALQARRLAKTQKTTDQLLDDLLGDVDRTASRGDVERSIEQEAKTFGNRAGQYRSAPTRQELADRVTSPQNRYFAWNLVNRVWATLLGRGIVEPIDDFRADNLPSNPALLDHLADEFVAGGYDFRAFLRVVVESQTYQRAFEAGLDQDQRKLRESSFCTAALRRMRAEVLYDSVIVAGHLESYKHPAGAHLRERLVRVAVRKGPLGGANALTRAEPTAKPAAVMARAGAGFGAEGDFGIERLLTPAEEAMLIDPNASMMAESAQMQMQNQVEYQMVKQVFDENPIFGFAKTMNLPAPPEHFLRQFGQIGRQALGEERTDLPTMRQSLILMNGQMVNDAARVGPLEPVGRLLGPGKPLEPVVEQAYLDIFTRRPTAAETQDAVAIIRDAESVEDGVADLRWALLNSNEFRFIP